MKRRSQIEHDQLVERLSMALRTKGRAPLALAHPIAASHLTRATPYKKQCTLLNIDHLDAIVYLDKTHALAIVEPRVSMEDLVKATLKEGWIPQVVPEFRKITVGGAFMGAALESSSCQYGLFNDTCEWCEVLLGNGEKLICSRTLHPDLFTALCGSYGTLAIVTLIAIRLIPSKPFVHLTYQTIHKPSQLLCEKSLYLDAIAFGKSNLIMMQGTLSDDRSDLRKYHMSATRSEWFYQHAFGQETQEELIPIQDYLFRYDRGAFWMGQFLLRAKPLILYLIHRSHSKKKLQELLKHQEMRMPSVWFRWLFGWAMSTQRLYRALHKIPDEQIAQTYLIQDCMVNFSQVDQFLQEVEEAYNIFPIWLCPVKKAPYAQLFAPHSLPLDEKWAINVGLYGIARWKNGAKDATSDLEKRLQCYQGRKALYSHCYYTESSFWSIYNQACYEKLRTTYCATAAFPSLTQKVLS